MRVTRPRAFIALLKVTPLAIGAITIARQNAAAPAFDVVSVRKSSTLDCSGLGTTTIFAMNVATPQAPKDQPCGFMPADGPGRIIANGIEMATLAGNLAVSLGRPVLDTTRLDGRYDVDLTYTPEAFTAAGLARRGATAFPGVDPNGPPLATALADQLGVKLESRRAPVSVLVIDRLESLIPD